MLKKYADHHRASSTILGSGLATMTRLGLLVGMAVGVLVLIVSAHARPSVQVVYNPSDSAPRGWYRVMPTTRLSVGDYVVARLPHATARLAATRGYLPVSVPVLKRIAAVSGQQVCVRDSVVCVDGLPLARTLEVDRLGRPMKPWPECRRLIGDQLFLRSTDKA